MLKNRFDSADSVAILRTCTWLLAAVPLILGASAPTILEVVNGSDEGNRSAGGWPATDLAGVAGPAVLGIDGWTDTARGFVAAQHRPVPEPVAEGPGAADDGEPGDPAAQPYQPFTPATDIERIACSKDWDCATAIRIIQCESRKDPGAVGNGSYGLWQIQASIWYPFFPNFWNDWWDTRANTEYAWVIYQRAGYSWRPWACWW